MIVIAPFRALEALSVTLGDGIEQVFIGADPGGKLVAQHCNAIEAGEEAMRIAQRQLFLGQEKLRDQYQGHVVMSGEPAASPVVGHAAGALGVFEGPLDEVTGRLHRYQEAQSGLTIMVVGTTPEDERDLGVEGVG